MIERFEAGELVGLLLRTCKMLRSLRASSDSVPNFREISAALFLARSFPATSAVAPPVETTPTVSKAKFEMQNGHMEISLSQFPNGPPMTKGWRLRHEL